VPGADVIRYRFERVLVVVDGRDRSRRALDAAISICHATGARLTVLVASRRLPKYGASIAEIDDAKRLVDGQLASISNEAQAFASFAEVDVDTNRTSGPVRWVRRYAAASAVDLIVVARRGLPWPLPSTADRVVRSARCPVPRPASPGPWCSPPSR
jgi:nucleotide-binding universal stress UspA family protein